MLAAARAAHIPRWWRLESSLKNALPPSLARGRPWTAGAAPFRFARWTKAISGVRRRLDALPMASPQGISWDMAARCHAGQRAAGMKTGSLSGPGPAAKRLRRRIALSQGTLHAGRAIAHADNSEPAKTDPKDSAGRGALCAQNGATLVTPTQNAFAGGGIVQTRLSDAQQSKAAFALAATCLQRRCNGRARSRTTRQEGGDPTHCGGNRRFDHESHGLIETCKTSCGRSKASTGDVRVCHPWVLWEPDGTAARQTVIDLTGAAATPPARHSGFEPPVPPYAFRWST